MRKPPLGELERDVLRFLSENPGAGGTAVPRTVREVSDGFGVPRGLARTTILTVMENLRRKGYLTRRKGEGHVFLYLPSVPVSEVMRSLVQGFVETTLGGSVSPIVTYLADAGPISDADLTELERLVEELRAAKQPPSGSSKP